MSLQHSGETIGLESFPWGDFPPLFCHKIPENPDNAQAHDAWRQWIFLKTRETPPTLLVDREKLNGL
jgi:hypothetical protein